jgi:hypothetical protein
MKEELGFVLPQPGTDTRGVPCTSICHTLAGEPTENYTSIAFSIQTLLKLSSPLFFPTMNHLICNSDSKGGLLGSPSV